MLSQSQTTRSPAQHPILAIGMTLFVSIVGMLWAPSVATAACPPGQFEKLVPIDGGFGYHRVCVDADEDDGEDSPNEEDNDGGGSEEPTCPLDPPYTFCEGAKACYLGPWEGPMLPNVPPDKILLAKICTIPGSGAAPTVVPYISDPDEGFGPSLEERAEAAYGEIRAPSFTLDFSPTDMTYVGTDTHFWVDFEDDALDGRIVGSVALGMRAVGEPNHIEIRPGDGSKTLHCPWTTAEADECVKRYVVSSVGSTTLDDNGEPSHRVQTRLVYDIHFEVGGEVTDIPGLPEEFETLESEWQVTPVPVGEIQALITQ